MTIQKNAHIEIGNLYKANRRADGRDRTPGRVEDQPENEA
jgi:hypothetical protein